MIILNACSAFSSSYRLFDNHLLDVGNTWEYQLHITNWPDAGYVDWWGTATREVMCSENIEGYDSVRTDLFSSIPELGEVLMTSNNFLTDDFLCNVRQENESEVYVVRNNDPLEEAPLWISDTDNNLHFGHGQHTGILKNPYYEWDGYSDTFITFLRIETITVPAGTFNCAVVEIRSEFHEFASIWGYSENTIWLNPAVGDVRSDEYAWMWNPVEGEALIGEGSDELVSTNVSYKQDFDFDFCVDYDDLSILLSAWLTELGEEQYNPDCDLYPDDFIDSKDIAVFAQRWRAGL